jgi:hypothetical protein
MAAFERRHAVLDDLHGLLGAAQIQLLEFPVANPVVIDEERADFIGEYSNEQKRGKAGSSLVRQRGSPVMLPPDDSQLRRAAACKAA